MKNIKITFFFLGLILFFSTLSFSGCGSGSGGSDSTTTDTCVIGESTIDNCLIG